MDLQSLVYRHIADLKSRVAKNSISPLFLGNILEEMLRYMLLVHISEGQHTLRMEIDNGGDDFIAFGETKHVRCFVFDNWDNVTDDITEWKITRDTGDAVEDMAWALKPKVKGFKGDIDLVFSALENDLGEADKTKYTVTATLADKTEVAAIIEI